MTCACPPDLLNRHHVECVRRRVLAEVVEWLRSLPQDEWYPANVADAIESRLAAPAPQPPEEGNEKR